MNSSTQSSHRGGAESEAEPLIDVHAHFFHDRCGRSDWREINQARLEAGVTIGISCHVASILGSWGFTSPAYMPSPQDVGYGNARMMELCETESARVRCYVMLNPNDRDRALHEIEASLAAGAGVVGLKLAASRRANDMLVDEFISLAEANRLPVLHHVWQHRRRDWPGQEASDAIELAELAARHPGVSFILAHIAGGGDYSHTFAAVRGTRNILLDISGSGVDRGMLDAAIESVGAERILWGSDITMETGLAKLRALAHTGLGADDIAKIRWRNAARIFPAHAFPMIHAGLAR